MQQLQAHRIHITSLLIISSFQPLELKTLKVKMKE